MGIFKGVASFSLLFFLSLGLFAEEVEKFKFKDFTYVVDGKNVSIVGYDRDSVAKRIKIPSKIKRYTVTTIGEQAFAGAVNLTSITIPDSVKYIGSFAFMWCTSLSTINIPNSVIFLGENVFYSCYDLTSIVVKPDHSLFSVVDRVLFNKKTKVLHTYLLGRNDTVYSIPTGIEAIGVGAFQLCENLTTITIPDSVSLIGEYAFFGCKNLVTVNISSDHPVFSVIDGVIFEGKTKLHSYLSGKTDRDYAVPYGITEINAWAFLGCNALTEVTLPDSVILIGEGSFQKCENLTTIVIPDSVVSIGGGAFAGCKKFARVTIPSSVTSIGENAFYECRKLRVKVVPGSYAEEYVLYRSIAIDVTD